MAKLEKHHTGHGKCKMVNGESEEENGERGERRMEVSRTIGEERKASRAY